MTGLEIFQWACAGVAWVACGFALRSMRQTQKSERRAKNRAGLS